MQPEKKTVEQLELIPRKKIPLPLIFSEGGEGVEDYYETNKWFLSRAQFLTCLRSEKRRSDRSKSPTSIILFSMGENTKKAEENRNKFYNYINRVTRETDIKGFVDEDMIGVILPDTDRKGVQTCIRKISQGDGHFLYSVVTATYPDTIFQKLIDEAEIQPDLFPLDLDREIRAYVFKHFFKRVLDIVGSIIGLIFFSPFFLIIALAIKLDSPGPIIFKQMRLGKNGEKFKLYKFRSMYENADDLVHREYITNLIGGNLDKINQGDGEKPIFKMKADERITKVGKIIRKLSLDELPQFMNVLRGEISLVGPRPPIPYEIEKYEPWHLRRILEMKPGITGLWQVGGRNTTTFNDMVRMDLRYVKNWTLRLDLKILMKTMLEVFRPSGAA
jgi:exopolysaccharide biosynthesis polyprenyl glycosylphosphotransferase